MSEYKIGDSVWAAICGNTQVEEICPVCFGKFKVTLILGNDEWVELPCDYCSKGYMAPRGVVDEYRYVAAPERVTIKAISTECGENGCVYRYTTVLGYSFGPENLFNTEEEARIECNRKAAEYEQEQLTRTEYLKQDNKKSYSWNAGYYKSIINKAKKDIEWYTKKYKVCTERAKKKEQMIDNEEHN